MIISTLGDILDQDREFQGSPPGEMHHRPFAVQQVVVRPWKFAGTNVAASPGKKGGGRRPRPCNRPTLQPQTHSPMSQFSNQSPY